MLSGVRVLDLSDERGHLAGKILADMGADVVKVEPPGGDPLRRRGPFLRGDPDPEHGIPWLALNTSKRSIVLDIETPEGREALFELAASADVLLESFAPGHLDALGVLPALRVAHPELVHCSVTPFGSTGPRARLRAHDWVTVAMGGNASMTGEPDGPPLRCALPASYFHAGPEAVVGTLIALIAREETGRGQHVDVSMQECQVGTLLSGPGQYALSGKLGRRGGARMGRTREIWAARDGWISFGLRGGPARIPNLVATVELMREHGMAPDWLCDFDWTSWNPMLAEDETLRKLEDAFGAFFRTQTMERLYEVALERRILLAPCNDAHAVLHHAQLRSRSLFETIQTPDGEAVLEVPGCFAHWQGEGGEIRVRRRAPRLGEHQDEVLGQRQDEVLGERQATSPSPAATDSTTSPTWLQGLHVLELGSGAAGPVAARYFAELGAEVVRIESTRRPDFLRFLQPDGMAGLNRAPMFALLNADKRSLTLDMSKPEARDLFARLVDWADVVSENFAPGVLERWGIDLAAERQRKPELVVVRSCLFGQTGPQRRYPGFGGQGSAIAGFNHLTGTADGEAVGPYATITDSLTPRYVAAALAAALWRRQRTGRGGELDVSQIEAGVYSLSEMVLRESAGAPEARRMGNRCEYAAPHGAYACLGEDRWLAIAVFEDAEWAALAAEMARDGQAPDARFRAAATRLEQQDELDAAISAWTREREAQALMDRLQAAGVEAGVVQNFDDLLRDPQLTHREHFVRVSHAELGELLCERSGVRLSDLPGRIRRAGPSLGAHGREVLEHDLGLSATEIAHLGEQDVLS